MRTLTRSLLATTAVAGLLALPVAGATAADTTVNVTLNSVAGTLSVSAPITTGSGGNGVSSVDLGAVDAGPQTATALGGSFGTVTVADSTTGLVNASVTSVDTGIVGVGLCQGTLDTVTGGVTCSGDANTTILPAAVGYTFGTVTSSGNGSTGATVTAVDGALGVANLSFVGVTPGAYELSWQPSFDLTLTGTELSGEYYGVITHSVL